MKKIIDKGITTLMVALCFISISAMDSENLWIPMSVFTVSGVYLIIHAYIAGAWCNSVDEGDNNDR